MDAKTKTLLDDWKGKKKSQEESKDDKEKNGDKDDKTEEGEMKDDKDELDEFTLREDRVAKAGLDAIMREYAFELAKEPVNSKPVGKWSSYCDFYSVGICQNRSFKNELHLEINL